METTEKRQRVCEVSLAALLHDVGKFAQRAEADPESYRSLPNLHEFAVTGERGAVSHHHAAYTWQFIEEHLQWLMKVGGPEGNVAQWAARHHKPSSVWDWIVAEADRLSSGMERGHPDEAARGWAHVQLARLVPLLARISDPDATSPVLPMRQLSLSGSCFPAGTQASTPEEAKAEYQELFKRFCQAADQIAPGHLERFFESFLSVYESFAWCVPAATNYEPRDVSLFEHSRAASSIATALAFELLAAATLSEQSVRDRDKPRYLLAVADLGGIQGFVYTIVSRYAARSLRGRSLALQLLADALGQRILREFGLPPTSLLYNGGGKLWLLLPASCKHSLLGLAEELDFAVSRRYAGRLSFTVGSAPLTGRDLMEKRISTAWHNASADMAEQRHRRLATTLRRHYRDVFEPFGNPSNPCQVCGQLADNLDPLAEDEEVQACHDCREFADLGRMVVRARCVVRISGGQAAQEAQRLKGRQTWDTQPYAYAFCDLQSVYLVAQDDASTVAANAMPEHVVLSLNEPPESWQGEAGHSIWLAGLNRATEEGEPLDFDGLARRAQGIKRLGILRMDVDSLGGIFQSGLPPGEATLSRMGHLSRGLLYFFGGYVSHLLRQEEWRSRVQLIYSGGDDLFAVGSWDAMPKLGAELRRQFGRFVGNDAKWGLSGGIEIVEARFPISVAAEFAREAEQRAKDFRRANGAKPKDALCLLNEAFGWEQFEVLDALRASLVEMFGQDSGNHSRLSRALLRRLYAIGQLYAQAQKPTRAAGPRPITQLSAEVRRGKWTWQAAYTAAQAIGQPRLKQTLQRLLASLAQKQWNGATSNRPLIELLGAAARWTDLLTMER